MHMSNARLAVDEGLLLWTLEEISRLVSQNGNPSETLGNVVHLIQRRFATDVCSVYLLEQDRASLMLAATVGLRPESVGRVRMRLTEGLAGLVAEELQPQVIADATRHPRFKYFREAGEDPYRSFLGVPIIDRGLLQGVLVVQTTEQRAFSEDDVRMLVTAGAQVGPIVSEARALGQIRRADAPAAAPAGAATCGGAGTTKQPASFASWIRRGWRALRAQSGGAAPAAFPSTSSKSGRRQLALHSRINYAYRRMQEYLNAQPHLGRATCRRPVGAAGRLFLGGVRPARVDSDLFGRPWHPRRRSRQERVRPRHPARRRRPVLRPGLFRAAPGSRRLAARGLSRRRQPRAADSSRPSHDGAPVTISIDTRTGTIAARVWKLAVGRSTLLLLDSNVEGNQPEDRELTARLYGGDDRVRIRQELLLGVGGVRALAALGISPGVVHLNEGHSAFAALELVRQRMAGGRHRRVTKRCGGVAPQVVFTTHTPVPAGHDRFSAELVEEHLGPLRESLGIEHGSLHGARPVDAQTTTARRSA